MLKIKDSEMDRIFVGFDRGLILDRSTRLLPMTTTVSFPGGKAGGT